MGETLQKITFLRDQVTLRVLKLFQSEEFFSYFVPYIVDFLITEVNFEFPLQNFNNNCDTIFI